VKGSYLAYRAGKLKVTPGTTPQDFRSHSVQIATNPLTGKPMDGQWTTISGMEGAPLTFDSRNVPEAQARNPDKSPNWRMFFAGEHCSTNFQGFMNGAAQTGRLAAQRILMAMIGPKAARLDSPTELVKLWMPQRRQFFVKGFNQFFG
jgi:hypothetical protein